MTLFESLFSRYVAKYLTYFGKIVIGLIFIVTNGQILANYLANWSHTAWNQHGLGTRLSQLYMYVGR